MDKTWILVADRVGARLFESLDAAFPPVEIASFVNPAGHTPAGSRGDARPPRTMESMGGARHAIEPHTTPMEKATREFARELRDALEAGRLDHRFDHLMLIAPPRFLGALRAELGKQLARCVTREIERDQLDMTVQEIAAQLRG